MKPFGVGIDPGKKGWIVAATETKVLLAKPIPYIGDEPDVKKILKLLRYLSTQGALGFLIEKQQVYAGQGLKSSGTTMFGYGSLKASAISTDLPVLVRTPQQWKREIGIEITRAGKLPKVPKPNEATKAEIKKAQKARDKAQRDAQKARKQASIDYAKNLRPGYDWRASNRSRTDSDGKAEAFLMAELCRRILSGEEEKG